MDMENLTQKKSQSASPPCSMNLSFGDFVQKSLKQGINKYFARISLVLITRTFRVLLQPEEKLHIITLSGYKCIYSGTLITISLLQTLRDSTRNDANVVEKR